MNGMLKRIAVVVVWMMATLGTASLTYAAVSQAGEAVGDNPAVPVNAADIAARVSTTTTTTLGAATPTTDGVTGTTGVTTTTVISSTTAATTTTSVPVTTTTGGFTTTTTAASHTEWKTVPGVGTVGVSVTGDSVFLQSATPVTPYAVDDVDDGPDRVEVEFKAEGSEYHIRAEVRDGTLVWEVDHGEDEPEG